MQPLSLMSCQCLIALLHALSPVALPSVPRKPESSFPEILAPVPPQAGFARATMLEYVNDSCS
jgi:hypothetical protein